MRPSRTYPRLPGHFLSMTPMMHRHLTVFLRLGAHLRTQQTGARRRCPRPARPPFRRRAGALAAVPPRPPCPPRAAAAGARARPRAGACAAQPAVCALFQRQISPASNRGPGCRGRPACARRPHGRQEARGRQASESWLLGGPPSGVPPGPMSTSEKMSTAGPQPAGLPIRAHADAILAAVRAHPVTVVIGETGSGKTTQIAQVWGLLSLRFVSGGCVSGSAVTDLPPCRCGRSSTRTS